jgi:hypothetical protein
MSNLPLTSGKVYNRQLYSPEIQDHYIAYFYADP